MVWMLARRNGNYLYHLYLSYLYDSDISVCIIIILAIFYRKISYCIPRGKRNRSNDQIGEIWLWKRSDWGKESTRCFRIAIFNPFHSIPHLLRDTIYSSSICIVFKINLYHKYTPTTYLYPPPPPLSISTSTTINTHSHQSDNESRIVSTKVYLGFVLEYK